MPERFQVGLGFTEEDAEILFGREDPRKPWASVVRGLIDEGLRRRMERHAKPVSHFWLDIYGATLREYSQFQDAVCGEAGVIGPCGNRYRFEPVPAASLYSDPLRQVYLVLRDDEVMGPDGTPVMGYRKRKGK